MAHEANPPFRSRSLVRSRIGAFRASDAGSNPAGSIIPEGTPLGPGPPPLAQFELFPRLTYQKGDVQPLTPPFID